MQSKTLRTCITTDAIKVGLLDGSGARGHLRPQEAFWAWVDGTEMSSPLLSIGSSLHRNLLTRHDNVAFGFPGSAAGRCAAC